MQSSHAPAVNCPICGRRVPQTAERFLPFCSDRCRLIDLGRWLDEEHAIPSSADDSDDEAGPLPPRTDDDPSREPDRRPPVRLPPGWHDA